MFGQNEIVGKKFFKDAAKDTLTVTSLFFTLQGEGPYGGMPALFIRLAKCNLQCQFCDTFFDSGDVLSFAEIENRIQSTIHTYWEDKDKCVPDWAASPVSVIPEVGEARDRYEHPGVVLVITGGEPLLQDNLTAFLRRQEDLFREVQIESNGLLNTVVPDYVTLVCSPKCLEKDGVAVRYLEPSKTILERADCLKFVMTADQASPYSSIPDWAFEWRHMNPGKEIYVSPMNMYLTVPQKAKELRALRQGEITFMERSTVDEVVSFWEPGLFDMKQNQANHEYVARYCMDHGLRMNMQLHLFASLA